MQLLVDLFMLNSIPYFCVTPCKAVLSDSRGFLVKMMRNEYEIIMTNKNDASNLAPRSRNFIGNSTLNNESFENGVHG